MSGPDLEPIVEELLGVQVGGLERLQSSFVNAAFAVHLATSPPVARTSGVVCPGGSDLVLRLVRRAPARIPAEVAVTRAARAQSPLPVPVVLSWGVAAEGGPAISYILATRLPGVPLSSLWKSLTPALRHTYLEQLVAMAVQLRTRAPAATLGAYDDKMAVVPAAGPGEDPLVSYYQSRITTVLQRMAAHPRAKVLAPLLPKLIEFKDVAVPTLASGYFGGFSLGHTRLRLRHVLVDPSRSLVTGVLGWEHGAAVCDEDGVDAIAGLCDTAADAEFVASAARAAGVANLPGFEGRGTVRRVLALCDKVVEGGAWYAMKAPAAEEFVDAAMAALDTLLDYAESA